MTGVQTCALPISLDVTEQPEFDRLPYIQTDVIPRSCALEALLSTTTPARQALLIAAAAVLPAAVHLVQALPSTITPARQALFSAVAHPGQALPSEAVPPS